MKYVRTQDEDVPLEGIFTKKVEVEINEKGHIIKRFIIKNGVVVYSDQYEMDYEDNENKYVIREFEAVIKYFFEKNVYYFIEKDKLNPEVYIQHCLNFKRID